MQRTLPHGLFAFVLFLAAGVPAALHAAAPEAGLIAAVDQIWADERPAMSRLDLHFEPMPGTADGSVRSSDKAFQYHPDGTEAATWSWRRRSDSATTGPWGPLPRVALETADAYRMQFERKAYVVISAVGAGLFSISPWDQYRFLQVFDMGAGRGQHFFPLVAPADLGVRVLGRLPGSPVLNYLRLIPVQRDAAGAIVAFEGSMYALTPAGAERVRDLVERPTAYALRRAADDDAWSVQAIFATPVTDALDARDVPFVASFAVVAAQAQAAAELVWPGDEADAVVAEAGAADAGPEGLEDTTNNGEPDRD